MEEVWKDIPGFEGKYQVSNCGKVRSLNHRKTGQIKVMALFNNLGYKRVGLCKNGKQRKYLVHVLVAMAFLPNPENLPYVNHKDESKDNNFVWINEDGGVDPQKSNLEWCTTEYNNGYGTVRERQRHSHLNRKDLSKPIFCVELNKEYPSQREAARELNIHQENISKCLCGELKTTGHFHWRWA